MRCTPIAVFTAGLSDKDEKINAMIADVEMTHSHPIVKETIYIY
jgi:hypothetical protein